MRPSGDCLLLLLAERRLSCVMRSVWRVALCAHAYHRLPLQVSTHATFLSSYWY